MDFEQQKIIFLETVKHLNDLNDLLNNINCSVDKSIVAKNLDNNIFDLQKEDVNTFLSSLLLYVFKGECRIIKIDKNCVHKLIIINFINTILEELNIEQIGFEVL